MKHILLAGSFGQGNVGDDAILCAMLEQLRARLPQVRIQAVANDIEHVRRKFGVETVYWADWAEISAVIRRTDLMILGGGGIFFDYEGFDVDTLIRNHAPDLSHYASFPFLARLFEKPLMIYGAGVGPLVSAEAEDMVRLAFQLAQTATVRDSDSAARLIDIGLTTKVDVTADAALSMRVISDQTARELLRNTGCDPNRPVIAIAPKPWPSFYPGVDWEPVVAGGLRQLRDEERVQLLLIPFQRTEDDPVIERFSAIAAGADIHRLSNGLSPAEVAGVIGQCDLLIGIRLHALIFAVLTGTAGLALTCEPKVRSLMRQIGHPELCIETHDLSGFAETLRNAWNGRAALKHSFRQASDALRVAANRNAELAVALLERSIADQVLPSGFIRLMARVLEGRLKNERAHEYALSELIAAGARRPLSG
jgi:polysaccharide pyruvyl transferase CsaB